jgi:hypothetical protein
MQNHGWDQFVVDPESIHCPPCSFQSLPRSPILTCFSPSTLILMSLWEVCGAETECPQTVLSLTVGIFLGAVAYGGLVTTGINCIRLLAPTSGNNVLQTQLLRWYISVLLIINTIFQVGNFLWTNFFPVFGRRIPDPVVQEQAFNTLELLRTLSVLLTAASTDGLLVSLPA